jgi:SAM-dependent methyltransferase
MHSSPLGFLGSPGGKRMLICGAGVEAVAFALAGADVYGFNPSAMLVQQVKDLARGLGLRDRAHLTTSDMSQLAYPNDFFDLAFGKTLPGESELAPGINELVRVLKRGARAAFAFGHECQKLEPLHRAFGCAVLGKDWMGVEKSWTDDCESHWSDSNRRPLDYESRALPLSYSGGTSDALARIRTATPFGTTPSR